MFRAICRGLWDRIWVWHYVHFGRFKAVDDTPEEKHRAQTSEERMDLIISNKLVRRALLYDIDWGDGEGIILLDAQGSLIVTPKGRAHIRKLIDEEKARRFEVKTLWVTKLILPLLAALIGIFGAVTGLVAVLQHKK
jgi:hypothetical protein